MAMAMAMAARTYALRASCYHDVTSGNAALTISTDVHPFRGAWFGRLG
jgi:hypothetical protein